MCQSTNSVYVIESSLSEEETFAISTVKKSSSTPTLITFEVNHQHTVTFEIDTGASCNILPLSDYVKATGDSKGTKLKKTATRLTMHNNTSECPMGRVMLYVSRNGIKHHLRFYIVNAQVTPILGRESCIGMSLIRILDSDTIYHVSKQPDLPDMVLNDHVLSKNTDVFEGLGELTEHYKIYTIPEVTPVVHPPRRLSILLQDTVKAELDKLVENNVIAPVTEPTPWVSSMVVVQKNNNKIRICLDPRDLNKAIQRSHSPTANH